MNLFVSAQETFPPPPPFWILYGEESEALSLRSASRVDWLRPPSVPFPSPSTSSSPSASFFSSTPNHLRDLLQRRSPAELIELNREVMRSFQRLLHALPLAEDDESDIRRALHSMSESMLKIAGSFAASRQHQAMEQLIGAVRAQRMRKEERKERLMKLLSLPLPPSERKGENMSSITKTERNEENMPPTDSQI